MKAVVVAAGDVAPDDRAWLADASVLVAADGGAAWLDREGVVPQLLVGDLDSADAALVARLSKAGTETRSAPAEKDQTDAELAVDAALDAGAHELAILGALGGLRLDHALANLLLLAAGDLASHRVAIRHGTTTVRCLRGGERLELDGAVGGIVSLLPVGGDAEGVVTRGLRYPLAGETLRFGRARGISNEVTESPASVAIDRGSLLVFEIAIGGAR